MGSNGLAQGQSNQPVPGGARLGGNEVAAAGAYWSRCMRIFLMIVGSSMQAITLTAPPHVSQVSITELELSATSGHSWCARSNDAVTK